MEHLPETETRHQHQQGEHNHRVAFHAATILPLRTQPCSEVVVGTERAIMRSGRIRHVDLFVSQTNKKLEEYLSWRLEELELAALMVDDLEVAGHIVVVSLGMVLPPSSVATRLRAVVQVRKRAGCAPY